MNISSFELRLILAASIFGAIRATLDFYGNEVKQRQSTITSDMAEPGARMWVDDPLDGASRPGWGYLAYYLVYIDAGATEFPRLQLQIWTSVENQLRKYELKASLPLENYRAGTLYTIASPSNPLGYPLEVTPSDRLGFTHSANFTPISLDRVADDQLTATTAHRTYYYRLEWNNNAPPAVNAFYRFSNDALRGVFSVGVILNNAPPVSRTEQYVGAELRSSVWTFDSAKVVVLQTYKLPRGRMTNVFLRFNATTRAAVDVLLWKPVTNSAYALVYAERVYVDFRVDNPYVKAKLINAPSVDETMYLGFRLPNASSLCFRISPQVENYFLVDSDQPLLAGRAYAVDKLRQYYDFSTGAAVEVNSTADLEIENRQKNQWNSKSAMNMKILFLSSLLISMTVPNLMDIS